MNAKLKRKSPIKFRIQSVLLSFFVAAISLQSCGSPEESASDDVGTSENSNLMKEAEEMEYDGKGFGPIKELVLPESIDETLAAEGKKHFEAKCTTCHKFSNEKYVGPGLNGITKRRKPEWIMNMILDPQQMTKRDPVAKELFSQFRTQMTNQNVTESDARSMLEYFRQMDAAAN